MIEQTGYYLQASGQICKIVEIGENVHKDNCYSIDSTAFYPDGAYYSNEESERDIIAYIPDALLFEILRIIEAYHTTDSFKNMIDNCYKNHLEKKGE